MTHPAHTSLVDTLRSILTADLAIASPTAQFSCRPVVGFTTERNTVIARFYGQIGLRNLDEFRDALDNIAEENPHVIKVILDLASLQLTRTAVGVLVGFASAMHGQQKQLYLYNITQSIRSHFVELGLLPFFTLINSEEDIFATLVV